MQFLACFSRLIKKGTTGPDPEQAIQLLQTNYNKAADEVLNLQGQLKEVAGKYREVCNREHDKAMEVKRLMAENGALKTEAKIAVELKERVQQLEHQNLTLNRVLQTQQHQQEEMRLQNEDFQQQILDAQRQMEALEQAARVELSEHVRSEEELRRAFGESEQQVQQLKQQLEEQQQQVQSKDEEIVFLKGVTKRGHAEHKKDHDYLIKLREENAELKKKQHNVIVEYRASAELTEEIASEFGKGFCAALSKVQSAGIDPKSAGFTDDDLLLLEDEPDNILP